MDDNELRAAYTDKREAKQDLKEAKRELENASEETKEDAQKKVDEAQKIFDEEKADLKEAVKDTVKDTVEQGKEKLKEDAQKTAAKLLDEPIKDAATDIVKKGLSSIPGMTSEFSDAVEKGAGEIYDHLAGNLKSIINGEKIEGPKGTGKEALKGIVKDTTINALDAAKGTITSSLNNLLKIDNDSPVAEAVNGAVETCVGGIVNTFVNVTKDKIAGKDVGSFKDITKGAAKETARKLLDVPIKNAITNAVKDGFNRIPVIGAKYGGIVADGAEKVYDILSKNLKSLINGEQLTPSKGALTDVLKGTLNDITVKAMGNATKKLKSTLKGILHIDNDSPAAQAVNNAVEKGVDFIVDKIAEKAKDKTVEKLATKAAAPSVAPPAAPPSVAPPVAPPSVAPPVAPPSVAPPVAPPSAAPGAQKDPANSDEFFTFKIDSLPDDEFLVVSFTGVEGLNELYNFDITLISKNKAIDFEKALEGPASLTLTDSKGPRVITGILATFTQGHEFGPYAYYRACLRPKLWWLTLTFQNQIFLDKAMPEFLELMLKEAGLNSGKDFELKFEETYEAKEMVLQYNESHYNFMSRWLEKHGAFYWFMESEDGEMLRLADKSQAHSDIPGGAALRYAQPSGLDYGQKVAIHDFKINHYPVPQEVSLRDYNYQKPDQALTCEAPVADKGRGKVYIYGGGFDTEEYGDKLAKIKAEQYLTGQVVAEGAGDVRDIRPGYLFTLENHYRDDLNQSYLTTHIEHEGNQTRYLVNGLGVAGLAANSLFYRNRFTAIPADRQFRPTMATPRPNICGFMHARIDAAGSGQYAELDEFGRYKIIFNLDRSDSEPAKASTWIRMMQPYAGTGENGNAMGFHAPLHRGAEVLLAFMEGNPDRPVIAGAVPDMNTTSPVIDKEQTKIKLDSAGGNQIHIEDLKDSEVISLRSNANGTYMSIGTLRAEDQEKLKALGL